MFDKWRKYSYAAQKKQRHRVWWGLLWVVLFFVLYLSFTTFIFSMRVLENETMQPGLHAGDRFIFSSYLIYALLPDIELLNRSLPFRRGNVVLVDTSFNEKRSVLTGILDGGLRFFTAQRLSFTGREEHFYIKRVIGLPGDEITMTNFVLRVRPEGGKYNLTEFELSEYPYDVTIPQVPALWDGSIPFSGNMDKIVLGENECFVLSDDRSNTNDSRTWGPIPVDSIAGKALFRYWPVNRMGRP
ncbi:MAG: signal peptidase I [Treponema sp.]|jgi:signal peptidase I|nr:signal peptidase I [Treponema sp.]